jgi:hypothetical protein
MGVCGELLISPESAIRHTQAVGSLHRKFVLETLAVASDGGNSECLAFALKGELAIVIFDTAVQIEPIPLLRVTDVVEGKIELRGPEKRYGVEPLALTEHVAGRGLSLALSYDPMLDANTIASERIGPAPRLSRRSQRVTNRRS